MSRAPTACARAHARRTASSLLAVALLLATANLAVAAGPVAATASLGGARPSTSAPLTFPLTSVRRALPAGEALHTTASPTILPGPLRATYGIDSLMNASGGAPAFPVGEAIGIVSWGQGYDPSDIATFFSTYYPSDFPTPKVIPVPVDGASPPGPGAATDPSGGSEELTLDIEWAGSFAPGATIYAIYGPASITPPYEPSDAAIEDAVHTAVQMGNLSVLSLSFGQPQGSDGPLETNLSTSIRELAWEGTTVVVASGDDGGSPGSPSSASCSAGPGVDFPAADPYVLAVGGTELVGSNETAWPFSGGGSASSSSGDPAPWWQSLGSAGWASSVSGEREVPDVSASALDNEFYYNGTALLADGTSFAAPLWAGVIAQLAFQAKAHLGFLDPTLYRLGAVSEVDPLLGVPFRDVTSGANCFESAMPGWNAVTGWGSPNALTLSQDLSGVVLQNLSVTLSPSSGVSSGSAVGVTVSAPASASLADNALRLTVLAPATDDPTLVVNGSFPNTGAATWQGTFGVPSGLGNRYVNVTALAISGSTWYVGSADLAPAAAASGGTSSYVAILLDYELPIFGGFILIFLAFRFYGPGRRQGQEGPAPRALAGSPPLPPVAAAGPTSATSGPSPTVEDRGSASMSPFCWRCGAFLTGSETACPKCGARFTP